MASVSFENVYKVYPGGVKAISDLNLEIKDREFVVFVGPSGCGKSTTLRMIAGLEDVSAGVLKIDDRRMNEVPPSKRDIAMVFQNYALYPHKTVYENMAFGLRMAKLPREEIDRRILAAAKVLGLENLLTRKPKALSGGQRQRVALGRAIVREPKVFLLDEPLSNLDAKLRVQMRSEISRLHRKLGITFVYVTHDQTEAMTMGSQIVVMKDGVIQQVDSPDNLYDHPSNVFVATFLGTPQMNLLPGRLTRDAKKTTFALSEDPSFALDIDDPIASSIREGALEKGECQLGIRPEDVRIVEKGGYRAVVEMIEKLGSELIVYCLVPGTTTRILVRADARTSIKEGDETHLEFDKSRLHLFTPGKDGVRIAGLLPKVRLRALIDGNSGRIECAGTSFELDEDELSRLVPEAKGGSLEATLEMPNDVVSLSRRGDDDLLMKAKIVHVDDAGKDGVVAYLSLKGNPGLHAFKLPSLPKKAGEEVELYLPRAKVTLLDSTSSYRLVARHAYTSNRVSATVTRKGRTNRLSFAHFSVVCPDGIEPGSYELTIPYDAFVKVPGKKKEARKKRKAKEVVASWFGKLASLIREKKAESRLTDREKVAKKAEKLAIESKKKAEKVEEREKARKLARSLRGRTITLHPVNEDRIGSSTILYANVTGFEDYVTIKGGEDDSCFDERHPRYTLDFDKLVFVKK